MISKYFEDSNPITVITLLSALLGDMIRVKGDANIRGKIAYVPQQAWMQNATLKNNILFGTEYKQGLYEKVSLMHIDLKAVRYSQCLLKKEPILKVSF